MTDSEDWPDANPDDPNEQQRYFWRLRSDYPAQTRSIDDEELRRMVREGLALCPALEIKEPTELVRFLALAFLITGEQRTSPLLRDAYRVVIDNTDFSARRRLNFIYRHLVNRPVPSPEPDFGPWFVEGHSRSP